MEALTSDLKQEAQSLGFVLSGVTASAAPGRLAELHRWLDAGYAGTMSYLPERREAYGSPHSILDGCRTLLMLAMPYCNEQAIALQAGQGRVARYAIGSTDYHDVIHRRLKQLKAWLLQRVPAASVRGVVDTAPLLEREFAEAAGLGWVGKNTLLLNRQWGSYFFLCALLTDLPLTLDPPQEKGFCGSCTACLEACPTNAFPSPFLLDARRCISYLTIEHRGPIDEELRQRLGDWTFGCDVCQEVCPWNRKTPEQVEECFQPAAPLNQLDLCKLLEITENEFRTKFRKTPLWRSRRRGIIRNAILCASNQSLIAAYPSLCRLLQDPEPLIRGASVWAISHLAQSGWRSKLEAAQKTETDAMVQESLSLALE